MKLVLKSGATLDLLRYNENWFAGLDPAQVSRIIHFKSDIISEIVPFLTDEELSDCYIIQDNGREIKLPSLTVSTVYINADTEEVCVAGNFIVKQ